jgi:hypothetical protein
VALKEEDACPSFLDSFRNFYFLVEHPFHLSHILTTASWLQKSADIFAGNNLIATRKTISDFTTSDTTSATGKLSFGSVT